MASHDEDAARIDGQAPRGVGLLIVDMINDLSFDGADDLRPRAERAADVVLDLRRQADRLKVPVIYVNDNFGQWHSDRGKIVKTSLRDSSPGRAMVRRVAPRAKDYFVIKPQVSGFYATSLPVLLPKLDVSRIVLTGVAADICILFTAADAHMRAYDLWIPEDAVASEDDRRKRWALDIMQKSLAAETAATGALTLKDWMRRKDRPREG